MSVLRTDGVYVQFIKNKPQYNILKVYPEVSKWAREKTSTITVITFGLPYCPFFDPGVERYITNVNKSYVQDARDRVCAEYYGKGYDFEDRWLYGDFIEELYTDEEVDAAVAKEEHRLFAEHPIVEQRVDTCGEINLYTYFGVSDPRNIFKTIEELRRFPLNRMEHVIGDRHALCTWSALDITAISNNNAIAHLLCDTMNDDFTLFHMGNVNVLYGRGSPGDHYPVESPLYFIPYGTRSVCDEDMWSHAYHEFTSRLYAGQSNDKGT